MPMALVALPARESSNESGSKAASGERKNTGIDCRTTRWTLVAGNDLSYRETIYRMVFAFSRMVSFREAFGRHLSLTASQFVVLIGTAYRQGAEGVSIRTLADHTQLAATHVTTEVGRLIGKGLLTKSANTRDRRGVLVRLTPKGEGAIRDVNPLLRRVNDCLFQNISREDFAVVARFLSTYALNTENALAEIRRADHQRAMSRGTT